MKLTEEELNQVSGGNYIDRMDSGEPRFRENQRVLDIHTGTSGIVLKVTEPCGNVKEYIYTVSFSNGGIKNVSERNLEALQKDK